MTFLTPPDQIPFWAVQDEIDPISKQNNVLTPPAEKQQFGWDRVEFPPRNYFNWLGRYTGNWIAYLAQQSGQGAAVPVANNTFSSSIFNITNGGLAVFWAVDTMATSNFYVGMAYLPPSPGSPIALNTIASSTLVAGDIQTNGTIKVTGGTGPYIIYAQTLISGA
jgi:hypothetical protein